jgi:hypothetical protein
VAIVFWSLSCCCTSGFSPWEALGFSVAGAAATIMVFRREPSRLTGLRRAAAAMIEPAPAPAVSEQRR